ncbi:hypothetical protein PHYSODRAFT_529594 [Phytophthora sojae]|uniref:DUF4476 domain-containing protein n=1 Tax=Phytophthora sojae (strain P6497) TaxID=1094619 RepID=G5ABF6_PHYSP|nr:hypothetical protein PHYSODRAFT_529594 [Phytophthora sojae]EGZ06681.1 hypothetical protein PHYSODRAFT_529594 [Phytophthora sojae]|eukprot:XP_009537445.1 hypothetical protein PHYSODRAFT_529594 [Phytophthora sojae]
MTRTLASDTINRLANTVEGLQQKLVLLEILVADRWLSSDQALQLIEVFPNAVRARARAACLTFSRIVDLENFIQIYDSLSSEDQEECVKRLGWLNILDPLQPDRQYPPLDLSIHDERELVQMLAQLALEEGVPSDSMGVLPPPGWGRPDAVGPDSVKHHGTVCLHAARLELRERVLCGTRLFL